MALLDTFVHLFAPLSANCRDFQAKWDAARPLGPEGISGCWEGQWLSTVTGHRGRLRCVVNPIAPALWRMYFRGEYSRIFRACYATDFTVAQDGGRWTFTGGSNLGALAGGTYEYSGYATLDEMVCTYRAARDNGEFRLRRVSLA